MPLNWSQLAPHRPLQPGDPLHVQRPQGGGEELAARLLTGGVDVVAVVGPVGSGKSTELAHAASLLGPHLVVVLTQLDRALNMRKVTEDDVFLTAARSVELVAREGYGVGTSALLKSQLYAPTDSSGKAQHLPPRDLLLSAIREVKRGSTQGRIALLVDGLEKCDSDTASRVVRALLEVRDEAQLALVAPYSTVVGSGGHELHASGAHFHFVRAVPVRPDMDPEGFEGRRFFANVVRSRLGLGYSRMELDTVLPVAAGFSGGLPRSFLQLVQATGSYAALNGRDEPLMLDLHAAAHDQTESLALLLEKGDVDLLREADGKSEREIPTEHRVRLLMQGLLLEYKTSQQGVVVHPAPLLQPLLARPAA